MKKLNRTSVSPLPLSRRPAPAPYFHPFFNFSDPPSPLPGEVIKIYSLFKKVGGGVRTMIEPETERQTDRYRETGYNEKLSDKF